MTVKPTYEELEQKVKDLEKEAVERTQVEKSLFREKNFSESIIDSLPGIFYFFDDTGKLLRWNKNFEKMSGYSAEEILRMNPLDFFEEEDKHNVAKRIQEVFDTGESSVEANFVAKNGTKTLYYFTGKQITIDNKKHLGGMGINIADRAQTEKALKGSEEKYRLLVKNLPSIVYKGYKDGSIEFFDRKIELLTGYDLDEFNSGRVKWIDLIIEEHIETAGKIFIQALKTNKSYVREYRIRSKTGKLHWLQERGQIVCDDNKEIEFISGTFFDITQRKHAEMELTRLAAIVQFSEDAIYSKTLDGIVTSWNTGAAKIFGYTEDEVVGKPVSIFVPPKQTDEVAVILEKIKAGRIVEQFETTRRKKDGTFIEVSLRISPIKDGDGNVIGASAICRDITETKRMEVQLRQAQRMEAIGTLAGGIAHDFNNILFSVMGYTELALDDAEKGTPLHDNLQEVFMATQRASDLIKQILTFSRQSNQILKPLKVQLIVKEALKLVRSSLPATIEIIHNISDKCGFVMADATQIHQVVMNLVTNSYHAMEDEGGKLDVTLKEVYLDMDDLRDPDMTPGTYICLTVTDTGVGIDASAIDRIFDPYFSTKEPDKGTGLGLSVVHGIVKRSGGDIKVYSDIGKGTAFHVYLPVIQSLAESEKIKSLLPVEGGKERILLVDDDEQIVRLEQQILERLGYHVTARTSSIETLEVFRVDPGKFDLVITDMTMPNMTGVHLAKKLTEIRSDIPIIICTGFSEKISEKKATSMGIRGYVMKPVIKSELAKKIRNVLEQS